MELQELVGIHILQGVDFDSKSIKTWGDTFENCSVMNFMLDGKRYTAVEDPGDGYRSCMKEISESLEAVKNTFPGQQVMAVMRVKFGYEADCILDMYDAVTGKIVVSVGTHNFDDYYPSFVAEFNPENMAINRKAQP